MSIICLKNITKIYKGADFEISAVDGISLEIEKGQMVAIMGKSGSGKTTLLNILGLIDSQDSGEYILNSRLVSSYSETEKAAIRNSVIGFVLQDFALLDRYTVEKNLKIPLMYSDIPKNEWNGRIEALLKKMGVFEKRNRKPSELSGGQKQRIAIARALITGADIILADEPTGALDSKTAKEIMQMFSEIKKEGKTIIIVTHDQDVAAYCDRIVTLEDGRIVNDKERRS